MGHLLRQWLSQSESLSDWWDGPMGPGSPPMEGARSLSPTVSFRSYPLAPPFGWAHGGWVASPCHVRRFKVGCSMTLRSSSQTMLHYHNDWRRLVPYCLGVLPHA